MEWQVEGQAHQEDGEQMHSFHKTTTSCSNTFITALTWRLKSVFCQESAASSPLSPNLNDVIFGKQ